MSAPSEYCSEQAPEVLKNVFKFIDDNKAKYVTTLREAVAIRSVSAEPEMRGEVIKMVSWTAERLKALGATVDLRKVGEQIMENGVALPLPPVLFGTLGNDPTKKTLLIYGHLDVQPAKKEDGWDTDPFVLMECHGKLYGRGATDDKGPVLGWLHAIEAFQKTGLDIPVNIKFVLEGMEESGSEGLDELLISQKDKYLKDVDVVCISDNYWLGKDKPCLTYGLRGLVYFFLEVEGGTKDLHSGVFGGAVIEPMTDLVWLMNQLLDSDGNIMVPGILDDVVQESADEKDLYDAIDFSVSEFKGDIGICGLRFPDDKTKTLMSRWRYPSLSLHGIQGCFSDPGAKTVIPRKVIGKFSIRLVPNQTPDKVEEIVAKYINGLWATRKSPNIMRIKQGHGGKPWMADPNHPNYRAAAAATKLVYGVEPDMIREGGSIPVTLTFQIYLADDGIPPWTTNPLHPNYAAARLAIAYVYRKYPDYIREGGHLNHVLLFQETTCKNVLLLPMGASDDGAHSQNEKIDMRNYIEGTKVMAAYLYELGNISGALDDLAAEKCRT